MMMHILYSIKKFGKLFDTKAERLMFRHPLLGFFAMFVGVPAFVLLAVGISTVIIMFPVSWMFGWM